MAKKEETLYEWDKLLKESPQMYERFCYYRDCVYYDDIDLPSKKAVDLTKRRSYRATAEHFGVAVRTIEQQAKRYRWIERCEAYDKHIALIARKDHERKVTKMLNNHALLGAAMVKRAATRFISLHEDELTAADTIRMADIGVKIERMSRGVSSDESVVYIAPQSEEQAEKPVATVDVPNAFDLSNLSDEELEQLDSIMGKLSE